MKPFIICEQEDNHPKLVFSKEQLNEIHITPGRFVDELDTLIDETIIGYETHNQYINESGQIVIKTMVVVAIEWSSNFYEQDAEFLLNQYKFIINKYYKKL